MDNKKITEEDNYDEYGQKGGDLLSSGGYGCVYYPALGCDPTFTEDPDDEDVYGEKKKNKNVTKMIKELKTDKYVSKIQRETESARNEIEISIKIKENIKDYDNFFSPITSVCLINLALLDKGLVEECDLFKKDKNKGKEKQRYLNMRQRYIKGKLLKDYIMEEASKGGIKNTNKQYEYEYEYEQGKSMITRLLRTHVHLLNTLLKLERINVIHYDLKNDNIMYDTTKNVPILIDYGLSIDFEKMSILLKKYESVREKKRETDKNRDGDKDKDKNKKIYEDCIKRGKYSFYVYAPDYYTWCPEILFLSYIYNKKLNKDELRGNVNVLENASLLNEYDIKVFSNDVVDKNPIFTKIFNKDIMNEYKTIIYDYYMRFVGKKFFDIQKELLKYSYTWDNYSLAITYVRMIYYIYHGDMKRLKKEDFLYEFSKYLLHQIHPLPERRLSNKESLRKVLSIVKQDGGLKKNERQEHQQEEEEYTKPNIGKSIIKAGNHMRLFHEDKEGIKTRMKNEDYDFMKKYRRRD